MTHIAVEMPEEHGEKRYWLLHYLEYTLPLAEPRYSEMLEVWKVEQLSAGWRPGSVCGGRLLWGEDSQPWTAAFYELTGAAGQSSDFFGAPLPPAGRGRSTERTSGCMCCMMPSGRRTAMC